MASGWIKLYRKIEDSWIYKEQKFDKTHAWIDLLILANHEDNRIMHRGKSVICKRGTVNRSIQDLSKRWGWHWRTTKSFLMSLQDDNMILLKCQRERTVITIVNWAFYQSSDDDSAKRNAKQNDKQNAKQNAKRNANKQEYKEYKEVKNIEAAPDEEDQRITEELLKRGWDDDE